MYRNSRKLQCYDLVGQELVWTYISSLDGDVVETYTTEMMDHGRAAVIMVGLRHEVDPSVK
jgi:hypothetical protein